MTYLGELPELVIFQALVTVLDGGVEAREDVVVAGGGGGGGGGGGEDLVRERGGGHLLRTGGREGGREGGRKSGGRLARFPARKKRGREGGREGGRTTYQVRDVGQGEAGGVPELVAEVAVAHHTLNIQVDVTALREGGREGGRGVLVYGRNSSTSRGPE